MTIIGIDNGSTGSVGIVNEKQDFFSVPKFKDRNYTKKEGNIHRVNTPLLKDMLTPYREGTAFIERPMVNFKASAANVASAIRALEAVVITLEHLNIPYQFIDSKEWQSHFFGSHVIGRKDLKNASKLLGIELCPHLEKEICKQKDADGLLIALYAQSCTN